MALNTMCPPSPAGSETVERPGSPFELKVVEAGRMALARVQGPVDAEHAPSLLMQLEPLCTRHRRLVLDLRRADYVDSAGVRALLHLHERLEPHQGELRVVVQPNGRVERTLTLLQLPERIRLYHTVLTAWIRRHPLPKGQ